MTNETVNTPNPFEQNLAHLNELVERMEKGELPLEDALDHYEQGMKLIKACQQTLTQAQQRIQILTQKSNDTELTDYIPPTS